MRTEYALSEYCSYTYSTVHIALQLLTFCTAMYITAPHNMPNDPEPRDPKGVYKYKQKNRSSTLATWGELAVDRHIHDI